MTQRVERRGLVALQLLPEDSWWKEDMRIVCQFSCGAASAVATKLALAQHGDRCVIVNAYLKNEHTDNRRFLADCERWFGRDVTVLRDEKFGADIVQVFAAGIALAAERGDSDRRRGGRAFSAAAVSKRHNVKHQP